MNRPEDGFVSIRLERANCALDLPMFDGRLTYNKFVMPEGSYVGDRDLSGMYFYPYVAYEDPDDDAYCIARFPEKYNVELINIVKDNEGTYLDKDKVCLTAGELKEVLDNTGTRGKEKTAPEKEACEEKDAPEKSAEKEGEEEL